MPDKKQYKTKTEYNLYYQNYRDKNRKKIREYNRVYNQMWRKKYGYHNEENSKKRYPEKEYARAVTQLAIRHGQLKRKPCEKCKSKLSQAHHDDYTKPLQIRWLCSLHHKQYHMSLTRQVSVS